MNEERADKRFPCVDCGEFHHPTAFVSARHPVKEALDAPDPDEESPGEIPPEGG